MERICLHCKERYQQVSLSRLSLLQVARQVWSEIGFEASAWHMGSSTDGLNQQGAQMGWEDEGGTVCEEEHMVLGRPETHPLF